MRVIVAGAGLGGLTLAWALGQAGADVLLLDQAAAFLETGAGIQLSPNAMRALAALGADAEIAAMGFAPDAVEVRAAGSRRLLMQTPLGPAAQRRWCAPYLQAHRSDLHAVLLRGALATGRVVLKLKAKVVGVDSEGVALASGERLKGEVVVGCDGVRSAVRAALWGERAPRFLGQVAWRGTTPAGRSGLDAAQRTTQVWAGPGRHFVSYPIRGGALINFVAVTQQSDWRIESWSQPGDKGQLLAAFQGWPACVARLIDGADAVWRWALYDREPLDHWSLANATLLGDAAHPMAPFLAQGAAMAIEDAVVLARCLAKRQGVEAALARYEAIRRARTAKVQAWSRRNGVLFHLPAPFALGLFSLAKVQDMARSGGGAARLDWLYGYDAGAVSV